jgi:hypothetical protein
MARFARHSRAGRQYPKQHRSTVCYMTGAVARAGRGELARFLDQIAIGDQPPQDVIATQ